MTTHEELRALAEEATPGPWDLDTGGQVLGADTAVVADCFADAQVFRPTDQCWDNARYIAAASPERVLALLDEIERLRGALDQMVDDCDLMPTARPCVAAIEQARAALEGTP